MPKPGSEPLISCFKHWRSTIEPLRHRYQLTTKPVDSGGPVVIILTSGCEVRGFDPGRGQWVFSERKHAEYDVLRKGSTGVGPVS